jgi:hypothetical protein
MRGHAGPATGRHFPKIPQRFAGQTTRRAGGPHGAAGTGHEAVMKQNLTAMKPFWRFCANVLKRLMCTDFRNDAPK